MGQSMFYGAAAVFILFTLLYALFSAAVVYHIRQYDLPDYPAPRIVLVSFFFLSALFWLFSTYFLFQIPSP